MKTLRIILCALALLATPAVARAQTAADSAGVLLGVATRLQSDGQIQLSRSILDLILQQFPNTPAAADARRLLDEQRTRHMEQSGKSELLVFSTAYGLFLGGAIPAALDADGPAAYGVGLIAGGPAGFLIGRAYAKSRNLTEGQARAITFGGTWGVGQGLGWAEVANATSTATRFTSAIAGSLVGIGVGTALSQKRITAGTATSVNFGGLWGLWYGGALATLAGLDDGDDDVLTAALIGGNAGILATAIGAPKWKLSRQRARLISISGVAGLLAGFGALLIAQPDGDGAVAVPIATSAAGLALGAYWTRDMAGEY